MSKNDFVKDMMFKLAEEFKDQHVAVLVWDRKDPTDCIVASTSPDLAAINIIAGACQTTEVERFVPFGNTPIAEA